MDPDAFADAMNSDAAECCKKKRSTESPKKRKIATTIESDHESNDSNWNRRKKKKKSSAVDSDSDDSVSDDLNRPLSKRKRPIAAKVKSSVLAQPPKPAPPAKTSTNSVAQEKAVSSISKNPNLNVKKVFATNQSSAVRKSIPAQSSTSSASTTSAAKPQSQLAPVTAASTESTEIDCTPDLFAFLVNHSFEQTVGSTSTATEQTAENSVSSSTSASASAQAPPPPPQQQQPPQLVIPNSNSMVDHVVDVPVEPAGQVNRQYVRRVARYQGTHQDTTPVMHNYNGTVLIDFSEYVRSRITPPTLPKVLNRCKI